MDDVLLLVKEARTIACPNATQKAALEKWLETIKTKGGRQVGSDDKLQGKEVMLTPYSVTVA